MLRQLFRSSVLQHGLSSGVREIAALRNAPALHLILRGITSSSLHQNNGAIGTGYRESVHYDVCIVGAGPSGLAAAIRFKQLCIQHKKDLSVCVVDKGAEIGSHILSGNVFEPRALDELIPDWRDDPACPVLACPVTKDRFYFLTKKYSIRLPTPPQMKNKGKNYVVSLGEVVRWLGTRAEALGVDIFPGFAAAQILYSPHGNTVKGIITNDVGITKNGEKKESYSPGMAISADVTLLAEGCRGSLSEHIIQRFHLRESSGADPQTYALGIKEVWEIDPSLHSAGTVCHTVGWPLSGNVYGGGWVYHMKNNLVSLGLVVALDYSDPLLSPFEEFQRFKMHPAVARTLKGGTMVQYGARTLVEGGYQSIPGLSFPGGALVGDSAGFLNVPKIKGTHTAMKSGMLAAEAAFKGLDMVGDHAGEKETSPSSLLSSSADGVDLSSYESALKSSWVYSELHSARNIRPGFSRFGGLVPGIIHAAIDTYLFGGRAPWTLRHQRRDHEQLRPLSRRHNEAEKKEYTAPDGQLTFDIASSLHRSGTNHEHDQPCHLRLCNPKIPMAVNLPIYGGPESKYCPAGVYEYVEEEGRPDEKPNAKSKKMHLQINAQNCLHCKACDIKDPLQNIRWTPPEGGGGPSYSVM